MELGGLLRHNRISSSRTFALTSRGKRVVDEMGNDTETRVLMAVEECEDGTIGQIEAQCHIRRRKLERCLRRLRKRGLIQSTREPSGDE